MCFFFLGVLQSSTCQSFEILLVWRQKRSAKGVTGINWSVYPKRYYFRLNTRKMHKSYSFLNSFLSRNSIFWLILVTSTVPSEPYNSAQKKKKARTTFSGRQVYELEKQFEAKKYLSSAERSELAKKLGVTETQVDRISRNSTNSFNPCRSKFGFKIVARSIRRPLVSHNLMLAVTDRSLHKLCVLVRFLWT